MLNLKIKETFIKNQRIRQPVFISFATMERDLPSDEAFVKFQEKIENY